MELEKTVHASHLAAHAAIAGLKVLLIDLDPQASATLMFGYIPSVDINHGKTIYSSLLEDFSDIHNIIKPTHYHGLDLISSGLELQSADLLLPNSNANNSKKLGSPLLRLSKALKLLPQYDIVVLDCAPNHAATTMNALAAANAVILPISPSMQAFGSSIQFLQTLQELAQSLENYLHHIEKNGDPYHEKELIASSF